MVSVFIKNLVCRQVNLYLFPSQAVCCSDHVHCCPKGYTCNVEKGSCDTADYEQLEQKMITCKDNKNPVSQRLHMLYDVKEGCLGLLSAARCKYASCHIVSV